ncbi:MAG: pyridoxal 5'-phosphate synthase glutaminase subunit PdxT [Bacteroidales bacterium]|jgi:5'-phosphate synthase pdxT subunit|nr:pyridoxal 5'-phosphate synthase glutaminase subunit PdxT [Bacteroidales bacterium]
MRIAILALQGAFEEHRQMLLKYGVESFLVRKLADYQQPKDALIIPGGESTTMLKLLKDLSLFDVVKNDIEAGLPVFGTCAGLIMLDDKHLGTMNIEVKRNAYGRQLGSFATEGDFDGIDHKIPMTFIRAPYIEKVGDGVEVLSVVDGNIVAARQGNQLVTAFHPELNEDFGVYEYFFSIFAA